jgi:hypothetical protein
VSPFGDEIATTPDTQAASGNTLDGAEVCMSGNRSAVIASNVNGG